MTNAEIEPARLQIASDTRLGYRPALDGLRALAVLPVMVGHTASVIAPGGFTGVRLFFVLSGFLISTLLLEEWADTSTIRMGAFYMRRALRLLPALFFLLIVYLLAVAVLDGPSAIPRLLPNVGTISLYVANWKFVAVGEGGALGHLWSLSVEEQFYLLWPIGLFLMLRYLKPKTMMIVTAVLAVISWLVSWTFAMIGHAAGTAVDVDAINNTAVRHAQFGTDAVAYALLAGCLAAMMRTTGTIRANDSYRKFLSIAGPIALVLYAFQIFVYPAPGLREESLLLLTIAFVVLILTVVDVPDSPLTKLLSWAPLRAIGKVSYGLYLWHFAVLALLRNELPKMGVPLRTVFSYALIISLVLISYFFVEKPFLRMKKRWVVDVKAAGHPE